MAGSSHVTLETVRAALQLPLPGHAARQSMSPRPRPGDRPDLPLHCPHEGAVLVLLYRRAGELRLPLTLRTERGESHRGQVSLPGGAREPQDRSFAETALREAQEELGIAPQAVEILGALTPLYIPVSQFCVHAYVGHTPRAFALRPDPNEVAQVLEASLDHLLDPATRRIEVHERDGQRYEIPIYPVGDQRVWGATAMILAEFLEMVRTARNLRPTAS